MDVSKPYHYTRGKIEVLTFILDQGLNFCEGNIIKYLCRWKHKNGLEDLKKAQVYLNKYIQHIEKQNAKTNPPT